VIDVARSAAVSESADRAVLLLTRLATSDKPNPCYSYGCFARFAKFTQALMLLCCPVVHVVIYRDHHRHRCGLLHEH